MHPFIETISIAGAAAITLVGVIIVRAKNIQMIVVAPDAHAE